MEPIKCERIHLRNFIITYRNLPILWDAKSLDYTKKNKRCKAYEQLLQIYRLIKSDATIEDVKRKINSMRSNFRKEMKKVAECAAIGIDHRPASWMYEELIFLKDSECPAQWNNSSTFSSAASEEDDYKNDNENIQTENEMGYVYPQYPPSKRQRYSQDDIVDSIHNSESDIAKVWAVKLKHLAPLQKLFAEKAINDVLFEAQLGTLHRNSVKINEYVPLPTIGKQRTEPTQSSPEYKYCADLHTDDN